MYNTHQNTHYNNTIQMRPRLTENHDKLWNTHTSEPYTTRERTLQNIINNFQNIKQKGALYQKSICAV